VTDDLDRQLRLIALAPQDANFTPIAQAILAAVNANKPLTDVVSVAPATVAPYAVRARLQHGVGADPSLLQARAAAAVQAVVDDAAAHVGRIVGTDALIAALRVPGVLRAVLEEPAVDFDPGFASVARASAIDIVTEQRDV
jgi:phage-related baseplate assembly protein